MRNGYAMCTNEGLQAIADHLGRLSAAEADALRARLRIVVQSGVELTEAKTPGHFVSQAFCSALPVAYANLPAACWAPFATLVLEAAYEGTLWAAAINAAERGSNIVLLTLLGGGAFGNDDRWIIQGLRRAMRATAERDLDVKVVSYGSPTQELKELMRVGVVLQRRGWRDCRRTADSVKVSTTSSLSSTLYATRRSRALPPCG